MKEKHPDRESYENIWDEVICKEIQNYQQYYVGYVDVIPNAKENIWDKYVYFNQYCKTNYMAFSEGKLDRHKVAACYMMAILHVSPICLVKKIDGVESDLALNEGLAITVGLSLICAFAMSAIQEKEEVTSEEKKKLICKFEKGIVIPSRNLVNHGDYQTNYCKELFFGLIEGRLSILSLAHELYLLETITRLS